MSSSSQTQIAQQVVEAILAQKLAPGERLGEQELADLFHVSRTLVREALMQLQARGFVQVRARRGWYVTQPSVQDARDAFHARRVIEAGMLAALAEDDAASGRPLQSVVVPRLRAHVAQELQAIDGADAATRAFLLADFHVCLADALGHQSLTHILRDLTARTTLAASLYQSRRDARQSCAEHAAIVEALQASDVALARQRMLAHLGHVHDSLSPAPERHSRRERLRQSLAPVAGI